MLVINDTKYNNGEEVYINNGRMKYIYGSLIGIREEDRIALIKIGTVTSEVEMDFIQKIHHDAPKLFISYTMIDNKRVYFKPMVASSREELQKRFPSLNIEFEELDEVDGHDVILQK
jgi:hypothetical protein